MRKVSVHMNLSLLITGLLIGLCSCSYPLKVLNMSEYQVEFTEVQEREHLKKVALLKYKGTPDHSSLHREIVTSLREHPSVEKVVTNWNPQVSDPDFTPDLILSIDLSAEFSGSGWNFLTTFPGFVLFLPSWLGYKYECDLITQLEYFHPENQDSIELRDVKINYDIRHMDFERGFWAYSGWWLPGYGATSAISGLFMMMYDSDVTNELWKAVGRNYGDYLSEQIIRSALKESARKNKNQLSLKSKNFDA